MANSLQPNLSYAQALRESAQTHQHHSINKDINSNDKQFLTAPANTVKQVNSKLEDMIMQLMNKIDIMLNLLTTVIAKMN